jgi:hypothetical protein
MCWFVLYDNFKEGGGPIWVFLYGKGIKILVRWGDYIGMVNKTTVDGGVTISVVGTSASIQG